MRTGRGSSLTRSGPASTRREGRARRLALRAGLSLITLASLLGALELGLRRLGYARVPALVFDPDVGNVFLPNQERVMLGAQEAVLGHVRIGASGYRGDVWTPGDSQALRVACLGDSFTFGWGVDDDAAYPAVLARLAEQRLGPHRIEIANLGVPGYTAWNELQTWRRIGRSLAPDVCVLGFFVNDLEPPAPGPRHTDGFFFRAFGRTALVEAFHRHVRSRLPWFRSRPGPELRELRRAYRELEPLLRREPSNPRARPYWDRVERDLGTLAAEVRADGARFLLVLFPDASQWKALRAAREEGPEGVERVRAVRARYQAYLVERAAEWGVPVLDLLPAFEASEQRPWGEIDGSHPGPVGYRIAAREVLAELARLGWLPGATGHPRPARDG